jgi:opacity protein-like surface antigen
MAPLSGTSIEVLLNIWKPQFERASMRTTWETFGMKRLLLGTLALVTPATAATAADLYTKARPAPPPVAPPLLFSWTGFYVGGNIGGGWENFNITDTRTALSLLQYPQRFHWRWSGRFQLSGQPISRSWRRGVLRWNCQQQEHRYWSCHSRYRTSDGFRAAGLGFDSCRPHWVYRPGF